MIALVDTVALCVLAWCAGLGCGALLLLPSLTRALRERDEAREQLPPRRHPRRVVQLRELLERRERVKRGPYA